MTHYKYCDNSAIDILRNQRLRVRPLDEFNDPFEFRQTNSDALLHSITWRELTDDESLTWILKRLRKNTSYKGNLTNLRQRLEKKQKVYTELITALHENIDAEAATTADNYVKFFAAYFGLLCLSAVHDDILMWSHYTQSHTGFVVGFDTSLPADGVDWDPQPVTYAERRPRYDSRSPIFKEQILALLTTKSVHWAYEREFRTIHYLPRCTYKTNDGYTRYYWLTPHNTFTTVILGCRISNRLEKEIRSELKKEHFRHVTLQRARIHGSKYALQITEA